jgi:hypothetical protein
MFRLENDITLLFVNYISFFRHEVQTTRQHIRFSLFTPKAICDDKLKSKQRQCPSSLALIQNMNCHEILQVLMVWIHNDFMLSSLKQMTPFLKGIHDGYNFFIMNLIINLHKKKLMKTKVDMMKDLLSFPHCENMTPIAKSKTFVSRTKGLERFSWIRSGTFVKETFKD